MARNGKIARLSLEYRNDLNQRLADGEEGKALVEWLNGDANVQDVLDLHYEGRPITEQNLSEWRQGGYQDWLRHQENLEWARRAEEEAGELQGEDESVPLSDRMAPLAAVVLGKLIHAASAAAPDSPEARRELLAAVRELTALRAGDQRAARLKMDLRRWVEEKAELEKKTERRHLFAPLHELLRYHDREKCAEEFCKGLTLEEENRVRKYMGMRPREAPAARPEAPAVSAPGVPPADLVQPNPTESDLIRPNPT